MSKNIIAILISILILLFSVQDFGYMFISLPFFVLLSYNLSDLILKFNNKKLGKRTDKNFEWIPLIPLFIILIFGRYFENTIGGYELFWRSAFVSLIFSVLTVYILSFYYTFNDDKLKRNNILGLCLFFLLLIPSLSIYINYRFSISSDKKERIEINKKYINKGSKGGTSYEIFIKTEFDKDERLDIDKELYEKISDNQLIELTLSEGILEYNYVENIKAINKY
ncbi:hypothetical protein [Chryseobacterium binzhouense]|uniref:hypothetical protein n=1 Tax=Chryseobacterium binzhouense TaxID=2593646 RepID=UPI00118008D3|nr:hypothetical protein [Chryseobacterium binzhouense]